MRTTLFRKMGNIIYLNEFYIIVYYIACMILA